MAQLWGGRFTKETDQLVYRFNASISFDRKFYEEDIEGSIAHAVMLEKQGILTEDEKNRIVKGLTGIREDGCELNPMDRGGREETAYGQEPQRSGGA